MTSPDEKIRKIHVLSDFHCFDMGNDEDSAFNQFILLLRGRNNIYDASNLRAAIKQYKFEKLHVDDNYKELNKSRRENAAVVVEEEYHQAMFNSYCLYANGYRVFPIMTAAELVWINEKKDILAYINEQKSKTLLVRDYDLQFIDEKNPSVKKKREDCNKKNSTTYNTVDLIRGAKRNQEPGRETNQEQERKAKFKLINTKENPFWNGFEGCDKFFISKGDDDVEVDLKSNKLMAVTKEKLILQGIKKPIEGIYASVQQFDFVKRRYVSSRDEDSFVTRRIEGDHSCPLDIYGIARAMVHRAENYYYRKNYRLAAVVAGEALLVLNGFHRSLMCRAYYIQAVSENAIAMSLLGGEEERLQEDIKIRLGNKLQEEVARLIKSPDRKNLLYNIYNDCMLFCKEREYFNAADEVLNIMVQVKEGVDLIKWFKDIKKRIEKLLEKKKKDNKLTERKVDKLS